MNKSYDVYMCREKKQVFRVPINKYTPLGEPIYYRSWQENKPSSELTDLMILNFERQQNVQKRNQREFKVVASILCVVFLFMLAVMIAVK